MYTAVHIPITLLCIIIILISSPPSGGNFAGIAMTLLSYPARRVERQVHAYQLTTDKHACRDVQIQHLSTPVYLLPSTTRRLSMI